MLRLSRLIILGLSIIAVACKSTGQAIGQASETAQTADSQQTLSAPATTLIKATQPSVASSFPPTKTPFPSPVATLTPIQPTPAFASLSSLRIAYTNDGILWLWQKGTATPLTTSEGFPAIRFSGDGRVIAFLRNGLWAIDSDGANERSL